MCPTRDHSTDGTPGSTTFPDSGSPDAARLICHKGREMALALFASGGRFRLATCSTGNGTMTPTTDPEAPSLISGACDLARFNRRRSRPPRRPLFPRRNSRPLQALVVVGSDGRRQDPGDRHGSGNGCSSPVLASTTRCGGTRTLAATRITMLRASFLLVMRCPRSAGRPVHRFDWRPRRRRSRRSRAPRASTDRALSRPPRDQPVRRPPSDEPCARCMRRNVAVCWPVPSGPVHLVCTWIV